MYKNGTNVPPGKGRHIVYRDSQLIIFSGSYGSVLQLICMVRIVSLIFLLFAVELYLRIIYTRI